MATKKRSKKSLFSPLSERERVGLGVDLGETYRLLSDALKTPAIEAPVPSEEVRRVLFFAKYNAQQANSPEINLAHLLAGFLRESSNRLTKKPL